MILNQHPRHRSPGRTFLRRLWSQGYLDAIDDETAMMMSGRNSSQSLALAIISSGLLECMADDHSLFQRMLKAIERLTGKIASPAGVVGNMIVMDRSDVASVSGIAEYPPLLPRGPDVPAFISLSSLSHHPEARTLTSLVQTETKLLRSVIDTAGATLQNYITFNHQEVDKKARPFKSCFIPKRFSRHVCFRFSQK